MTGMKQPTTLPEALEWMSRGINVYAEGLELDDIVLLRLGSARFNTAVDVAIALIKAEKGQKKK